jgi:hypothetical protein
MTEEAGGSLPAAVTKACDVLLMAHEPRGQVYPVASIRARRSNRVAHVEGA